MLVEFGKVLEIHVAKKAEERDLQSFVNSSYSLSTMRNPIRLDHEKVLLLLHEDPPQVV